jgi:hypothetical protein
MGLTMVSKTFNFVNAADGQADCITTDTNGEDYSWDAVWKSKAIITAGWVIEMRIPYMRHCVFQQKVNKHGT